MKKAYRACSLNRSAGVWFPLWVTLDSGILIITIYSLTGKKKSNGKPTKCIEDKKGMDILWNMSLEKMREVTGRVSL